MKKMLIVTLLVTTPLLFSGCARKNPLAVCDKLEPTPEEVNKYGNFLLAYDAAKLAKQEDCRDRVRGWKK